MHRERSRHRWGVAPSPIAVHRARLFKPAAGRGNLLSYLNSSAMDVLDPALEPFKLIIMPRGLATHPKKRQLDMAGAVQFLQEHPDAGHIDLQWSCDFTLSEVGEVLVASDTATYQALGFSHDEIQSKALEARNGYRSRIEGLAEVIYYAGFFRCLHACTYADAVAFAGSYERFTRAAEECLKRTDMAEVGIEYISAWVLKLSQEHVPEPRPVKHQKGSFPVLGEESHTRPAP